jgi:hypothetical protein
MRRSIKELCKFKNITAMSGEEALEAYTDLSTRQEKERFLGALFASDKFDVICQFYVVVGRNKKLYEIADKYRDHELFEDLETKQIKALVYKGPLLGINRRASFYPFKAGDGKSYQKATLVEIERKQ